MITIEGKLAKKEIICFTSFIVLAGQELKQDAICQDLTVAPVEPISETKVNTNLTIEALARYYSPEGEQLGVGPLPPQAGETTEYWIFLQPATSINLVKNILISAALPANVRWTNEIISSGQAIKYEPATRRITWQLDELKPLIADDYRPVSVGFSVELTPTEEQISQPIVLLKDISVTGQDDLTGQELNNYLSDLTTG